MQQTLNFETKSYHNTIKVYGEELKEATESAESQEEKVKKFFEKNPNSEFTPYTVMDLMDEKCINSVRRCITNLTKKGVLRKTGKRVHTAVFGVKNNCWKYNIDNQ